MVLRLRLGFFVLFIWGTVWNEDVGVDSGVKGIDFMVGGMGRARRSEQIDR